MILIYSENENASVGLPAAILNGAYQSHRSYRADGHTLVIDGNDEILVSEDAEQILATPGFRLATASEQEQYAATKNNKKGSIKEKADAQGEK